MSDPRIISFVIPGRIGGKQRAGRKIVFRHNAKPIIQSFNPQQTAQQEAMIGQIAYLAMARLPPLKGPVEMVVSVTRMHPASWSKKRCRETFYITGKPDCDNTIKLIADALNGIAYQDDCQIAALHMKRTYAEVEAVTVSLVELRNG